MCSVQSKKWKEINNLEKLKKAFGENGERVVNNQMKIQLMKGEMISFKKKGGKGRKRQLIEGRELK